jgi:septum formation protein
VNGRPDPKGSREGGAPFVLASGSPRRADILRILGLEFSVEPTGVDESLLEGEFPAEHVLRLAEEKARSGSAVRGEALVLGGDTAVVLDGRVLGKPGSESEATSMLLELQGREHEVLTGLALAVPGGRVLAGVQSTRVSFREFGLDVARAYVATGEPMDKAGAYGIQGAGAALVASLDGDYFNVVGLPVPLLLDLLDRAGYAYRFGPLVRVGP